MSREIQVKMVFKLENVYIIYPKIPDMHMELKNRSMSHHMAGGLIPKWSGGKKILIRVDSMTIFL